MGSMAACQPLILGYVLTLLITVQAQELLKNPGFESADFHNNWNCWECHMESRSESFGGHASVGVTNRSHEYRGLQQDIHITAGQRYQFNAHVKLLNDVPGQVYQIMLVTIGVTWQNGHHENLKIAATHFLRVKVGWQRLAGDVHIPLDKNRGAVKSAWIRIDGPDAKVGYLVDDTSLTLVQEDSNWRTQADYRIELFRKSPVTLKVQIEHASADDAKNLEVEVVQKRHKFGFGSALTARYFIDPTYTKYAETFFELFEWAVLGLQLKWPAVEKFQGCIFLLKRRLDPHNVFKWKLCIATYTRTNHIGILFVSLYDQCYCYDTIIVFKSIQNHSDFTLAQRAIEMLHERGVPVRGHNILWSKSKRTPKWLLELPKSQIWPTAQRHLKETVEAMKGKVVHWDVYNEIFQSHFYEEITGDIHISYQMYEETHKYDPGVKLFLNEQWAVSTGMITEAYRLWAKKMLAANVPLHRLGVQSHFNYEMPPDPTMMKRRLDRLMDVGLPIWITEMDFVTKDRFKMADWYETAYRLYFSHPAVEGILIWGFWNEDHWRPDAAFVEGDGFTLTEAGRRYKQLMANWTTHLNYKLLSPSENTFHFRGFHGEYDVIVKKHGHPIKLQSFSLNKGAMTVVVKADNTAAQIALATPPPLQSVHTEPFALPVESMGKVGELSCITRWSEPSEVGNDKSTSVTCHADEIITDCGSIIAEYSKNRDGEYLQWVHGHVACVGQNGAGSKSPVYAAARCCRLSGMHCTYLRSGFSGAGFDDQIEARCPLGNHVLGCTSYTYYRDMDGSFPSPTGCVAQNDGTLGGVQASAACCTAPKLECMVKYSVRSEVYQSAHVSTECPSGFMMMGCSVYSEFGETGGSYITHQPNSHQRCIAINGSFKGVKSRGVRAVATCCRQRK
ncbi:uncharacterized protein LOC135475094 [Liolophura sinensis]|uniref:uncharacterized protein LOC135475094 n=1 Tax=Liolophura sinensis TaxID=3198878 RepID=UPI00315864E4